MHPSVRISCGIDCPYAPIVLKRAALVSCTYCRFHSLCGCRSCTRKPHASTAQVAFSMWGLHVAARRNAGLTSCTHALRAQRQPCRTAQAALPGGRDMSRVVHMHEPWLHRTYGRHKHLLMHGLRRMYLMPIACYIACNAVSVLGCGIAPCCLSHVGQHLTRTQVSRSASQYCTSGLNRI
jgi:hypothetical protein